MNLKAILIIIISILFYSDIFAQKKDDVIQFSGVVVSRDSLKPVPYTSIIVRKSYRGTVSDFYGFFSFAAKKGDTIEFASIGYKRSSYIIPDTLTVNRYSLIQMLGNDTVYLKESVIYAWPTQEQFREAFVKLNIPNDDMERAKINLAREAMKERADYTPMDGSMNYKYNQQQRSTQLYYVGQFAPNNLLNPVAWTKFIEAWQNGEFKKKEKKEEDK